MRTILMVLSLIVSTGLIVTMSATVETIRRSNVDLISSTIGRYDIAVGKTDLSPEPFVNLAEVAPRVLAADDNITAVYPRFVTEVELSAQGEQAIGT
ncbi:MAG: hypothetical protein KC445_21315, partial [Anaerolineales bacterium]|nr:hypothetical protein [Anaerolineales bacterium]